MGPRVRMCRGCCCGTERKHPDVNHDAIAAALEGSPGPAIEVVRVECLWACEHSNVVVVNPASQARQSGSRPAWITEVNTVERAQAVADWVRAGGPGMATPPAALGPIRTGAEIQKNAGW
jgi:(2Fe-2S) ferredoxin